MSTVNEREKLKKKYPSPAFATKVDKMTDNQVIAIFRRLQQNKSI